MKDHPCPKCGYIGARTAGRYLNREGVWHFIVECDYDCTPYLLPTDEWREYQENWEPEDDPVAWSGGFAANH